MKKLIQPLALAVLLLLITGCGLKGNLELPEQQQTMHPA